jgi:hypothetical protein
MPKKDTYLSKLDEKLKEIEKQFLDEKATETIEARDIIIKALKENEISLPASVFALEIVKWELLRGQYEEFVGHVVLNPSTLPLSDKKPSVLGAKLS